METQQLTHSQMQNLSMFWVDRVTFAASKGVKGMQASEAKSLVAKGLLVEAAKPKGFGNTRAWKLTEAGREVVASIRYTKTADGWKYVSI